MNKRERNKLREQLIERFSDLVFEEETHKYYLKSDPEFKFKLSCSKIASLCKKEFDKEYWLDRKSKELNVSKESLEQEWKTKNTVAIQRGVELHKELEDYTQDNRKKASEVTRRIYRWLVTNGYSCIASELRLFDKELAISGTMDLLDYNKFTNKFYIIDWKTNKHKPITKIETYIDKKTGEVKQSNFKFEKPFNHLPQSKYYEYSMQLSTYKLILERNFDIKIEGIILVQISDVLYPEGFCIIPGELLPVNKLFNI
jgi:hypothetical protein